MPRVRGCKNFGAVPESTPFCPNPRLFDVMKAANLPRDVNHAKAACDRLSTRELDPPGKIHTGVSSVERRGEHASADVRSAVAASSGHDRAAPRATCTSTGGSCSGSKAQRETG